MTLDWRFWFGPGSSSPGSGGPGFSVLTHLVWVSDGQDSAELEEKPLKPAGWWFSRTRTGLLCFKGSDPDALDLEPRFWCWSSRIQEWSMRSERHASGQPLGTRDVFYYLRVEEECLTLPTRTTNPPQDLRPTSPFFEPGSEPEQFQAGAEVLVHQNKQKEGKTQN